MADPFLPIYDPSVSVPVFGTSDRDRGVYPNDGIILDVYNYTNDYLESTYRLQNYTLSNYEVTIDVEEELKTLQYYSGKYNVTARFYRNYLGSGDGDRLKIEEVSSDRYEIRVTPELLITGSSNNLYNFFQNEFFELDKQQILPNLSVFKDSFTSVRVFDYVQDPFTFDTPPFSIIFKLGGPLPTNIQVGDFVWIAQEISDRIQDNVTVIPVTPQLPQTIIAGPNFSVITQNTTNIGTDYKDWDDILSTNAETSLLSIGKLFSGSLLEGIPLNIDFRKFENFIHFGSVEERLHNFKYKMSLLESYDSVIENLTTNYNSFPANSALTASADFISSVVRAKNNKAALLGTFDTYERYLYYESSSYENNTFGEYYPTTWPKQTNTKPYVNYSVTSSQAVDWFNGIILSASVYDQNNVNALRKIVPQHVYDNPSNEEYVLFVDMIGHYFDLIYAYIKQLTSINQRYESLTEGFAKDLIVQLAQSLGLYVENGTSLEDIWKYALGTDDVGTYLSPFDATVEDRSKEVWKRIIANIPYLLKTKGTARGIRALINCYGIPSTILRVREFGGPDTTSTSRLEYDQFYYGLLVSGSSQTISVPVSNWQDANGTTGTYSALELRFRLDTTILTSSVSYNLLTGPIGISLNPDAGTVTVGSQTINVPLYEEDTDWWSILVNGGSRAYVGANRYGKALIYSSSANPGSILSSNATIGGIYGVVNEFRLWKNNLDVDVFKNHVLAPTSFQGPLSTRLAGSTSSFDSLKVRHTFGSDGKRYDASATTIISAHPDQNSLTYQGGAQRSATFAGYNSDTASYWIPQVETHYLEALDGGATRVLGNKIRIEQGIVTSSNYLDNNTSVIKSLSDTQPIDIPRVGVYFSPNDEVSEDISEQFGGYDLRDFIGDPRDYYREEYSELDLLSREYFKKYKKRNDVQGFIRLTQNYDASLFQLVKQLVPERALLHTGVVIESTQLHRNKIANKRPSHENLAYDGIVQTITTTTDGDYPTYEAEVEPAKIVNSVVGSSDIYSSIINTQQDTISIGEEQYPQLDTTISNINLLSSIDGEINNSYSTPEPSDTISTLYTDPARYYLYTWYQTGSGEADWRYSLSVGRDYYEAIQPTYTQNSVSDLYTTPRDRFNSVLMSSNINNVVVSNLGVLGFSSTTLSTYNTQLVTSPTGEKYIRFYSNTAPGS